MAKYIVKYGDQTICYEGKPMITNSKETATSVLIWALTNCFIVSDTDPMKFHIEEVEDGYNDVPTLIPDYDAARLYLNDKQHPCYMRSSVECMPYNRVQIEAFNELLTIAKAWNKADGFVPDWMDKGQEKFSPIYIHSIGGIVADQERSNQFTPFVFKTIGRAHQFGEKFIDLFKRLYDIPDEKGTD